MRPAIAIVIVALALGPGYGPVLAQTRPSTVPALESIRMINALTGWAVTATKALLRTTDGGTNWRDVTPLSPPGHRIVVDHVAVLASLIAWVSWGTQIFHTVDGGRTWRQVISPAYDVRSIHFVNNRDGWLLSAEVVPMGSENADIYRTIDGGESWFKVASARHDDESSGLPFDGTKLDVFFLDATTGWVTGTLLGPDSLYLYVTRDGGRTWRQQTLSLPPQVKPPWYNETTPPTFFTARDGVLPVFYSYGSAVAVFYATHDGGSTWTYTTPVSVTKYGSPSSFVDVYHGWVAEGDTLYVTGDGGHQWTKSRPGQPFAGVRQLDFISLRVGLAVRQMSPFLLKTLDGGHTWAPVPYFVSRP